MIGVLKWVLRIVFVFLVLVVALNFLYVAGTDTIVPAMHDAMGDTAAFHLLFFGYDVRAMREPAQPAITTENLETEEELSFIDEPTAEPEVESTIAIPDLDSNGDFTESPVVDVAPVTEEDPAADAAAGTIG